VTRHRRQGTLGPVRASAAEVPKSLELEVRVGRLETRMKHVADAFATIERRVTSIQAQLDHIAARLAQR
jgi:hypothetical protein